MIVVNCPTDEALGAVMQIVLGTLKKGEYIKITPAEKGD